ncbi:hypothetical protein CEXT_711821 [Caerostris extrusa]|uniref:Uncharacterized protein n=1 Tax=Caerostris extrusa TaxID=172846 RepID=A0AAV4T162_CAEEX|nr:hypothetical protein CEXT_711821 [Caerostris extrusa]
MEPGDKPEDLDDGRGFLRYIYEGHVNANIQYNVRNQTPQFRHALTLVIDNNFFKPKTSALCQQVKSLNRPLFVDRDYCVSESTSPLGQRVTTLNSDRESDKWPEASLNGSRDLSITLRGRVIN